MHQLRPRYSRLVPVTPMVKAVAGTKELDALIAELQCRHSNNQGILVVTTGPNMFRVYWRSYEEGYPV